MMEPDEKAGLVGSKRRPELTPSDDIEVVDDELHWRGSFSPKNLPSRWKIAVTVGVPLFLVCAIAATLFTVGVLGGDAKGLQELHKDPNWKLVPQTIKDSEYAQYSACTWSNATLPGFIVPRNYEVELQANLDTPEKLVFGHIIITADILEDTPCVVFNADNQSHWQVHQHINEYKPQGEFIIPGYGQWVDSDKDDVTEVPQAHAKIAKYNSLLPRLARLHFRFKYNLMDGRNNTGGRNLVTYDPPSIRHALPVLDDAYFKATWNVTLIAPDTSAAIFNTECLESNRRVQHLPLQTQPWTLGVPSNYTAHHFRVTEPLAPADVRLTLQFSRTF